MSDETSEVAAESDDVTADEEVVAAERRLLGITFTRYAPALSVAEATAVVAAVTDAVETACVEASACAPINEVNL